MKVKIREGYKKYIKPVIEHDKFTNGAENIVNTFLVREFDSDFYIIIEGEEQSTLIHKDLCEPVEETDYLESATISNENVWSRECNTYLMIEDLYDAVRHIIKYLKEQRNEQD